jgi:hypothetical protein
MADDKDNVTQIKAAASVDGQFPTQIPEADRLRLNEIYMETLALRNGLQAQEMQINLIKAQMAPMQQRGMEMQQKLTAMWNEIRLRLGIPDGWDVQTQTGKVVPPQQPNTPQ